MFILDNQYQHGPDDEGDDKGGQPAADAAVEGAEDQDDDDPSGLGPDGPDNVDDGADKPPADDIKDLNQAMLDQLELEKGGAPKPKEEPAVGDKPPAKTDEGDAEAKAAEEARIAAVDKEIKDLNIKNPNAQKRFRELTEGLRTKDEQIASFAKTVGVEPERFAQVLPTILESANRMAQWDDQVTATGATPEDFGQSMAILHSLKSDDIELKRAAYAAVGEVMKILGDQIGEHADPLAKHADLQKMVDDGELDPKVAAETARLRNEKIAAQTLAEGRRTKDQQNQTAQAEIDKATNDVVAYTSNLATKDPMFGAKFEHLKPVIARIQTNEPPANWAKRIQQEFDNIAPLFKAPKPAPKDVVPARVGRVPGRATGAASIGDQRPMGTETTDPMQGLRDGMNAALEKERRALGK